MLQKPLGHQSSCLKNPRGSGAWWAAIHGVTQSQTRLKQLSSSSSSRIDLCEVLIIMVNKVLESLEF